MRSPITPWNNDLQAPQEFEHPMGWGHLCGRGVLGGIVKGRIEIRWWVCGGHAGRVGGVCRDLHGTHLLPLHVSVPGQPLVASERALSGLLLERSRSSSVTWVAETWRG